MKFVSKTAALIVCSFAMSMSAFAGWGYTLGKDGNCYKTYDGTLCVSGCGQVAASNCQNKLVSTKNSLSLSGVSVRPLSAAEIQKSGLKSNSVLPSRTSPLLLKQIQK